MAEVSESLVWAWCEMQGFSQKAMDEAIDTMLDLGLLRSFPVPGLGAWLAPPLGW